MIGFASDKCLETVRFLSATPTVSEILNHT